MSVVALVGAQYGSEGKGTIAYELAPEFDIHVRVGGPNAGHTIRHEGHDWKMRSIPCGWVNPDAFLVIGAGALVDVDLLQDEVLAIGQKTGMELRRRLLLDPKALVVDPVRHHQFEGDIHGEAHRLIGSTGHGVGPARMAHMARTTFPGQAAWSKINHLSEYQQVLENRGYHFDDTAAYLQGAASDERDILIEGTQGSGLSLVHGPWPYVTSCDTNVAQMLVDTGLPPGALTETILVARTYPIRVAGHSGPMFKEIDWGAIGVEPERTTVTDKIRRVGMWDEDLVKRAIAFNQPCSLAITFLDYLFPGCQGARERHELSEEETLWLMETEERLDTKIQFVGTGPSATKFEVVRL